MRPEPHTGGRIHVRRSLRFYDSLQFDSDGFHLGVLLQPILPQLPAYPRLFKTSERRCCVYYVIAIHPHRTRTHAVCDGLGLTDIAGPYGCR